MAPARGGLAPILLLGWVLLAGGCAQAPGRVVAMPPVDSASAPPPPAPTEVVVRRSPWLARNFDELTPAQQRRIERQMARSRQAASREEARVRWDTLGLEERRTLIFPRRGTTPAASAQAARRLPTPPPPPPPPAPAPTGPPGGS
jgi:hypothetical protein